MKQTNWSRILLGAGFSWIAVWAIFGSLLGAKINSVIVSVDLAWLNSWGRTLLRSAHAHMNGMGITLVLVGLAIPKLQEIVSSYFIKWISLLLLVSIPVFGFGLCFEAFVTPEVGKLRWISVVTALGAVGYILSISVVAAIFLSKRDWD